VGATTASAGADNDAVEEHEVILGHPILRVSGDVSLFEAMGMAHWALKQVHDVLHQEREDIDDERWRLLLWVSPLKKQTTSKKEKAEVKWDILGVKEELINRKQAAIEEVDT
jgi:hypothetical protein